MIHHRTVCRKLAGVAIWLVISVHDRSVQTGFQHSPLLTNYPRLAKEFELRVAICILVSQSCPQAAIQRSNAGPGEQSKSFFLCLLCGAKNCWVVSAAVVRPLHNHQAFLPGDRHRAKRIADVVRCVGSFVAPSFTCAPGVT